MRGKTSSWYFYFFVGFFLNFDLALSNLDPSEINLHEGFHLDIDEVAVSAGHFHTCAIEYRPGIDFGGPLRCWGTNTKNQASPPPGVFVQISCGHMHSCAVAINETVSCWGELHSPQGFFTQVSSGENHACGILKDGTLSCWGRDDFGQSSPPNGTFVQVGKALINSILST